MTVAKLDYCILHLTKVEFDGSLVLNDDLFLVVENLLCNSVRSEGFLVASKINLRLLENPAVVVEQTFCLLQLRLVGTWIDVNQRVAFVYDLSLGIMHCKDLTAHLAEDVYRGNWRYRSESINIDAHIALICCADANDDGMVCFIGSYRISLVLELSRSHRKGDAEHHDGNQTNGPYALLFGSAALATWAGCSSLGCEILTSVSSRYGVICNLPGRDSDASVRAPLASETGIEAPHRIDRKQPSSDLHEAPGISIVRRATVQCC